MPTLNEVLQSATDLAPAEVEWLQLLVGDWQLISDLSFGDLVLWVPGGLEGWLAVAHVRPTTGQMVFFEDVVGRRLGDEHDVPRALDLMSRGEALKVLIRP